MKKIPRKGGQKNLFMTMRLISESDAPLMKMVSNQCEQFPEWTAIFETGLASIALGKVLEISLSETSLSNIHHADKKMKYTYFTHCLNLRFRNLKMPFKAWSRVGSTYIKRLPAVKK